MPDNQAITSFKNTAKMAGISILTLKNKESVN